MHRFLPARVGYANVMSTVAVFIALGGTSYAAVTLKKGSVASREVKDQSLEAIDLAPGVITSGPAGARGPRGIEGTKGDQGVAGPVGPAGATGRSDWQPLALAASWTQYGGAWAQASFRKDAAGVVRLRGLVTKVGTPAANDLIGVLPSGFRPASPELLAVTGGQGDGPATLVVYHDGRITWQIGPTIEPDHTSLSGVTFAVE